MADLTNLPLNSTNCRVVMKSESGSGSSSLQKPLRLSQLISLLADQERDTSPSIVPSLEEMQFPSPRELVCAD
jgi:hypothetical protein